jgi:putative peptide zinc metalloprotease protein
MSTVAASLIPSANRPLVVRRRPDLDVRQQAYEGRRFWVVKDPLTLRYYRFQEEEHAILSWLDGTVSLTDLRKKFERQFTPQKISAAELHQFLGTLYRSSLVLSDAPGQTEPLLERAAERNKQTRRERWSNLLSIRFRGYNPDALLTWLNGVVGWLFTVPAILCACLFGLSALLLLFVEFQTVQARLPGFHEFFTLKNWLWLSVALTLVKVLHEFGHGLACKRLGGECHEMGVMLLVFSPCLYANVSDAWTLPSKWHRAAIGAAGMYVELILASLATFVWWSTKPGLPHYLALNVMFVCSISTLVFNANPLMRFDGYYILSDLLEIPNLRTKASRILQTKLGAWLLGLKAPHDPFLPTRNQLAFATFAVAAGLYGWLVTASILWTLLKMFEPYGFKIVGMLLAAVAAYAMVGQPVLRLISFLKAPGRAESVNKLRAMVSGSILAALVISLAWLPLPRYVTCSVMVQPSGATAVYVDVEGKVREVLAEPFTPVAAGAPILRLENVDLELALARLEGERSQMATRLEALRERSLVDDEAAQLVAHTEEALAALEEQFARKTAETERLTIVAPAAGVLTPPAPRAAEERTSGRLAVWNGHPLELRNVGAHLETGTVVGHIGDAQALSVMLAIDETEIDFVRAGQRVDVVLDQLPGKRLTSQIATLSTNQLEVAPPALSSKHGGTLDTRTDRAGQERPLHTTYQASAPLVNSAGRIVAGTRGTARISAGSEALGTRLLREVRRTLAWEL